MSLYDSCIECVRDCLASLSLVTVRVVALEYITSNKKSLITWLFVSLEALKMYCVMRASA